MLAPCGNRGPREVCPGKDQTCGAFSIPTMWAPALVPHPAQNPPTGKATSGPLSPSPHVGEGTKAERGRDLSSVTQRGLELPGPEGSVAWRAEVRVSHWPAAGGRFDGSGAGVSLVFSIVPGTQWVGLERPLHPDGKHRPFREGTGWSQPAGEWACS